jgi:hypothetical protein
MCHGLRIVTGSTTIPLAAWHDFRAASSFSRTMRPYSADEHVPDAIIHVRRSTVSTDAAVSSANSTGNCGLRLMIAPGRS